MAAVSVLQSLVLIAASLAAFRMYRRITAVASDLEERHLTPAMMRVNALLDDTRVGVHAVLDNVEHVTSTVREDTDRVDLALRRTVERVDRTLNRVRGTVGAAADRMGGLIRRVRGTVEHLPTARGHHRSPSRFEPAN